MNVLVVDTSVWISYLKGDPQDDIDLALKEGRVYVPPLVVAELLSARLKIPDRQELSGFLAELPLCETPFQHWSRTGELRARLAKSGLNVSTPDAHVAQCALDLKGYLLSEDAVFTKIAAAVPLRLLKA